MVTHFWWTWKSEPQSGEIVGKYLLKEKSSVLPVGEAERREGERETRFLKRPSHQRRLLRRISLSLGIMESTLKIVCIISALCISAAYAQQGKSKDICKKDNGFFPHEDYCDYYYECVDGVAYVQECPNGLAFSGPGRGLIDKCDYPHRVGCPDPDNTRIMGQPAKGSAPCPYLFGIYPHEKSCTRYWLCWNGTGSVQMCPFSLLYNEQEHACDWPEKVPGCQQHPLCKGAPNGYKAIQGSCVRYWQCVGGYPRLQRCPAGLAFDQETFRCDWNANVPGCEVSPAPEEVEEDAPPARRSGPNRRGTSTEEEVINN